MPWVEHAEGHHVPDGPFEPPLDSFDKVWNYRLKIDGPEACAEAVLDPREGWPLSTRNFSEKPASVDDLVSQLATFFEPSYQQLCLQAGNTDQELDTLAKRLLAFAAMLDAPVTDRERQLAKRLGVDLDANPRREESRPPVY